MLSLILGIKRSRFREGDSRREKADAEFAAKRPAALMRHKFMCQACGYESKEPVNLDVHHFDDDHHNNADDNLLPACHTCHPYQHIGELVKRVGVKGEGLGAETLIATIPEISASDLNLLQRAIGVALLDEKEAPVAKEMIKILGDRAYWTKSEFGTYKPGDFAAAMWKLTDEEYGARDEVISDQRLLFNEKYLMELGREMVANYPSMPLSSWPDVAKGVMKKSA